MSESQLDRVATWRKAYRELPPGLTTLELALLMAIERRGMRDVGRLVGGQARPDVGWSVRDDGQPDSRRELAAIVGLGPTGTAKLNAAIDGLIALKHVVVADDGAVGLVGWSEGQEPPASAKSGGRSGSTSTERVRRFRERKRGGNAGETQPGNAETQRETAEETRGNAAETRRETPHWGEGGQRTEDRGQRTELVGPAPRAGATLGQRLSLARRGGAVPTTEVRLAKLVGLDAATIRAFEADEQVPTRQELEAIAGALGDPAVAQLALPERDPGVVVFVVDLHRRYQVERGIVGPDHPPPRIDGEVARWVWAPGGPPAALLDEWRIVLRRAAEKIQREQERRGSSDSASWFTLDHLAKAKIRRGYLDNHDLDRRSPPPQAPGRGRGRGGGLRGPPPPVNDDLPPDVQGG